MDGIAVGNLEGKMEGLTVISVGFVEGKVLGVLEGNSLGDELMMLVGKALGFMDGDAVGIGKDGTDDGDTDGFVVGRDVGLVVGDFDTVGLEDGSIVGCLVGIEEGFDWVGAEVGDDADITAWII